MRCEGAVWRCEGLGNVECCHVRLWHSAVLYGKGEVRCRAVSYGYGTVACGAMLYGKGALMFRQAEVMSSKVQ